MNNYNTNQELEIFVHLFVPVRDFGEVNNSSALSHLYIIV